MTRHYNEPDVLADIDANISALEQQLAETSISATKQFALKRQLQMEKAARIREVRKRAQGESA